MVLLLPQLTVGLLLRRIQIRVLFRELLLLLLLLIEELVVLVWLQH